MSKENVLKSMKPQSKAITLGEEEVFLSQWTLGDADKVIEAQKKYTENEIDCNVFFAVVAIASVCDADGKKLFSDDDVSELATSSAVTLKQIYREAMELNTIKIEDGADAEKN